ncbi:MAG: GNAT family N-acetyltransferase [Thalassovita sp.]
MTQIRSALSTEAASLAELIDAAYQAYRDQGIALPDVSAGVDDAIAGGSVWVAETTTGDGAMVQGVLMVTLARPVAHLVNVAVAPNAAGQGVGGQLIRFAIELAQRAGCDRIDLATHRDLSSNISLYQHLGWEVTERDGPRVCLSRTL